MYEILHCSSEVVPFSKSGGLADVSSALPEALSRLGHRVSIVTPLYATVDRNRHGIVPARRGFDVTIGGRTETFDVHEAELPSGTHVYLLENEAFFGRPQLYGTRDGAYEDNHLRYAFFSAAAFRLLRALRLRPDVLHCHDWQTALVPVYNHLFHLDMFATVMTIHNLAYQGLFPSASLPEVSLPWELFNPEQLEFWGKVNFLKAGLVFADRITTVSPRYAREILTDEMGCGLQGVLRKRAGVLSGILNGVDYREWSPETDPYLPARFSADDLSGKNECRAALLRDFGLEEPGGPVFGVVGRLTEQKGFRLFADVIPGLVEAGGSVVILGAGDRDVEEMIEATARRFPARVAVRIAYDNGLAHRIEAGSDFFMMPSRFEPCGLNQLYSLRYGTLPIVHAVGGLDDTVLDLQEDPDAGTGYKFREFERLDLMEKILLATALWHDRTRLGAARRRGMLADFGWDASARAYETLYGDIVRT